MRVLRGFRGLRRLRVQGFRGLKVFFRVQGFRGLGMPRAEPRLEALHFLGLMVPFLNMPKFFQSVLRHECLKIAFHKRWKLYDKELTPQSTVGFQNTLTNNKQCLEVLKS